MALTFPLSVAAFNDQFVVQSVDFGLVAQQELSGTGAGELLAADLGPRLWQATVSTRSMLNTEARRVMGLVESLGDARRTFYLYDPLNAYPRNDPGGLIIGASAVTIRTIGANNKSLALQGLPAGYVISAGDMFAITYSSTRRGLYRAVETVTANGSGQTIEFELSEPLRPGMAIGNVVGLKKPAAKMKLLPGSAVKEMVSANRSRIRFSCRQTLAAD